MRAKTRENAPKTHPVWLPVDYPILPSVPCLLPCSARCPISGGWSTRHPATAVPVEVPVIPPAGRGQPADPRGRGQPVSLERTKLALRLEGVIAGRAKERQQGGQGGVLLLQKSAEAIDTRQEIAKAAGVSHDTVATRRGARHALQRPRYGLRADRVALGPGYRQKRQRTATSAAAARIMPVMQTTSGPAGGSSGAKVMAGT